MPVGKRRSRTLYGIGKKRGTVHRYTLWRWGIGIVLTVAVALLPLTGTLRIDFWGGNHRWLGEPIGLVDALKAFAFPFLAVNVLIIVASRFLGRWLCGFGCPIGNLNRFAEWFRWRHQKSWKRHLGLALNLALCFLLAAITFSFWVDWRVFAEGSRTAVLVSGGFLGGLTLGLFALTQWVGMRFCREYCPSGVYFALLGPDTRNGIEFVHPETCTECKACEAVCPVDLHPTEMAGAERRPGMGFYPDVLTNYANCIRCGDCVVACEATTNRYEVATPLRIGFLPAGLGTRDEEDEEVGLTGSNGS